MNKQQATTNKQYADKFEELNGTQITQLFWIAASLDTFSELEDFLQEIEDRNWDELFPQFGPSANEHFEGYCQDEELVQLLIEYEKYGFIAEIQIPECHNFVLDGERVVGFSIRLGSRRVEYAYGETIDELYAAIEAKQTQVHAQMKAADLKKKQQVVNPQN